MANNTQDYWVFELHPSSGILTTREHYVSEIGPVSVLRRGGTSNLLGPLEITNINHWKTHVSTTIAI
jgi:hypothetical protein